MTLDEAQKQNVAPWDDMVLDLGRVKVYRDRYPVTQGHRLFVPVDDNPDDIAECFRQAYKLGQNFVENGACDSFNLGMNKGTAAGQTVMYPHIHLIPRRKGDVEDPVGGVRGVVPGQANYKKDGYKNPTTK